MHFDTAKAEESASAGAWHVGLCVAATCELRLANANCQWREQVPLKYPVHVHAPSPAPFSISISTFISIPLSSFTGLDEIVSKVFVCVCECERSGL